MDGEAEGGRRKDDRRRCTPKSRSSRITAFYTVKYGDFWHMARVSCIPYIYNREYLPVIDKLAIIVAGSTTKP